MTRTERDKWLLAALPAIATGLIYVWGFGRPLSRDLANKQQQNTELQANAVTDESIAARQKSLGDLQSRLADAKLAAEKLHKKTASHESGASDNPSKSARKLSQVLAGQELEILATSRIAAPPSTLIRAELVALAKSMTEQHGRPAPQVWRVEFLGAYPQVINALDALARSEEFALPLTVDMSPAEEDGKLRWVLTLWL